MSMLDTYFQESAFDRLRSILQGFGLAGDDVFTLIRETVTRGDSDNTFFFNLYQTPSYKVRFRGIFDATGAKRMTEGEYVQYERGVDQLAQSAGFPPELFDPARLIEGNVSLVELRDRIVRAGKLASSAPQEVRDAFAEFYGASGTVALAALFGDPDMAEPILERMADTAELGGTGRLFGYTLTKTLAEQLRDAGITAPEAANTFRQAGGLNDLREGTITEAGIDTDPFVKGIFSIDSAAKTELDRARERRVARTSGAAGTSVTEEGIRSLASAED